MITMESVAYGYGRKPLFEGLDLTLAPGSIAGLLGLNGAGKTSLLKLIAGALLPASGRIDVAGEDPTRRRARFLASVVFVPEDPWAPRLKVCDWLDRQKAFRPAFDQPLYDRLAAEFELGGEDHLARLSFGQRKKHFLAFALASGATTLLLDEPTDGLDIPAKATFRRMLVEACRDDRIILVSTHQVRDLENLIDPVVIMHQGKVPFVLPVNELAPPLQAEGLADLETLFTAAIEDPGRIRRLVEGTLHG